MKKALLLTEIKPKKQGYNDNKFNFKWKLP